METTDVLAALAALAQASRLAVFRLLVQHAPDGLSAGVIAEKLDIAGGWQLLADANTATISDPDVVFPGQVLQLPA